MSNVQLKDQSGNSIYPLVNKDCFVFDTTATYEGDKITLTENKCKITQIGTFSPHTSGSSPQGLLYRNGELLQFYIGGLVDVFDAETMTYKRSFQINIEDANEVHFGGMDWLDADSTIAITHQQYGKILYKIDLADESDVTIDSVTTPDVPDTALVSGAIPSADIVNNVVYLSGYVREQPVTSSPRTGVIIYKVNPGTGASSEVLRAPYFHLQDSCWHNGRILYISDSTSNVASTYDYMRVIAIDPFSGIKSVITVPGISSKEAEGICVADGKCIYFIRKESGTLNVAYKIEFP